MDHARKVSAQRWLVITLPEDTFSAVQDASDIFCPLVDLGPKRAFDIVKSCCIVSHIV